MLGKMKDRAAVAAAAGMAAASQAATKAKKTAQYGVSVAKDALGSGYAAPKHESLQEEDQSLVISHREVF